MKLFSARPRRRCDWSYQAEGCDSLDRLLGDLHRRRWRSHTLPDEGRRRLLIRLQRRRSSRATDRRRWRMFHARYFWIMSSFCNHTFISCLKYVSFYFLIKNLKKTFFCLRQSRIGGHDCADKCRRLSQRCPDKRRTSLHLGKLQGIRGQDRSHAGRKGSTVSHSSCSPSQSHQDCFRFSYFGFLGKLIYCSSSVVALFFIS